MTQVALKRRKCYKCLNVALTVRVDILTTPEGPHVNTKTNAETAVEQPLSLSEIRERPTLTVAEAGRVLGLGRDAAYRAAKRGDLPVIHVGPRRVVVSGPRFLALLGAD